LPARALHAAVRFRITVAGPAFSDARNENGAASRRRDRRAADRDAMTLEARQFDSIFAALMSTAFDLISSAM
jgi:hypothetical protein